MAVSIYFSGVVEIVAKLMQIVNSPELMHDYVVIMVFWDTYMMTTFLVLEEPAASIFTTEKFMSCTLKMEAVGSSKTLKYLYQTTWCQLSEYHYHGVRCSGKLKLNDC